MRSIFERNRPGEYWTIAQRADFYKWYSQSVHGMGHQIWWPAAAAFVSSQMAFAVQFRYAGLLPLPFIPGGFLTTERVVRFMNRGNKQVFDSVFGDLADVYFGRVSPGAGWDFDILQREQDLLQPLYEEQNRIVVQFLSFAAKNPFGPYPLAQVPFRGNIMIPDHRVAHGMTVANTLSANPGMYEALLRLIFP